MIHIAGQLDPAMLHILEDGPSGWRKIGIAEHHDGNGDQPFALACFPQHSAAAIGAKMIDDGQSSIGRANVFVSPLIRTSSFAYQAPIPNGEPVRR